MDVEDICQLEPMLQEYLRRFDDCFVRKDTRAYLSVYVRGELSNLEHGSGEPIAQAAASPKAQSVEQLARSHPALRDQDGQAWRIQDGEKSPIVWKVKHAMPHVKNEDRLPTTCYHLPVCDHPWTDEQKYFLSNAPADTPLKELPRVAFSRWPIERCFEDQNGEVGLTHWEGRTWLGLQRHLILSAVSHLFLVIACQKLRGKKSGGGGLPGSASHQRGGPIVVA